MENFWQKDGYSNKFPFPANPIQHQKFEFETGFVTPGSQNSPAGHLFFNGQLLPHVFLSKSVNDVGIYSQSTSSVSRNDSLWSSRSNSTSSRSSKDLLRSSQSKSTTSNWSNKNSLSSTRSNSTNSRNSRGRTSISEACDRKVVPNQAKVARQKRVAREAYKVDRPILDAQYGSQRWQFITQTPLLNHQISHRKKSKNTGEEEFITKKRLDDHKAGDRAWFGQRFFRSFVLSCKKCHAMEPSKRNCTMLQGDIELK